MASAARAESDAETALVPCVLYAAKSTEDRRGSIPDQLRDCRAAVEVDGAGRIVIAEYTDEAVSAYSRDRGQGLADAMQHVEDLAREYGDAELWAQHSDRLARGDGRLARHVVEIGLWALKRDLRVRTVQDPDTFRDLLYAVVTGQRNHEDSRRKSLAVRAGHRRAVERGVHMGPLPDGYRMVVEIEAGGTTIVRRVELDPERQQLIELIFRLALRRRPTGSIARRVNDAGWRTKPNRKGCTPRTWTCQSLHKALINPRYAGLTAIKGEVLGRSDWPTYITERQHHRIRAWLTEHRQVERYRPRETYLFNRLAHCGLCGAAMQAHTGKRRVDGTLNRRYVCSSHAVDRSADACQALPVDADMAEAMFVSALPALFPEESAPAVLTPLDIAVEWTESPEREAVIAAVAADDGEAIDQALERLLLRMSPEVTATQPLEAAERQVRRGKVLEELSAWSQIAPAERTDASRAQAGELNGLLRTLLTRVALTRETHQLTIAAHHPPHGLRPAYVTGAQIPRVEWARFSAVMRRTSQPHARWDQASIIAALRHWAEVNGKAPRSADWAIASLEHPNARTVRRHFGRWLRAVAAAGLRPANPLAVRKWQDDEILRAIRAWSERHGRAPRKEEWKRASRTWPSATTVHYHFGTWSAGVAAALGR